MAELRSFIKRWLGIDLSKAKVFPPPSGTVLADGPGLVTLFEIYTRLGNDVNDFMYVAVYQPETSIVTIPDCIFITAENLNAISKVLTGFCTAGRIDNDGLIRLENCGVNLLAIPIFGKATIRSWICNQPQAS